MNSLDNHLERHTYLEGAALDDKFLQASNAIDQIALDSTPQSPQVEPNNVRECLGIPLECDSMPNSQIQACLENVKGQILETRRILTNANPQPPISTQAKQDLEDRLHDLIDTHRYLVQEQTIREELMQSPQIYFGAEFNQAREKQDIPTLYTQYTDLQLCSRITEVNQIITLFNQQGQKPTGRHIESFERELQWLLKEKIFRQSLLDVNSNLNFKRSVLDRRSLSMPDLKPEDRRELADFQTRMLQILGETPYRH